MILKYGLLTILLTTIPYFIYTNNFTVTIIEVVKDLYLEVFFYISISCEKLINFGLEQIVNYKLQQVVDEKSEVNSIFTTNSLRKFDGKQNSNIYLSILGNVFDVTKGKKFYGPSGDYHIFAGKDVSRSFITGEFTEEGSSDDVIDLSLEDLRGLKKWLNFYHKEYKYIGKLHGRFFDKTGNPTAYNHKLMIRFEEAEQDEAESNQSKLMYPPCNVEWTAEEGSRVWCTKASGGINRDWIGVPRKLYNPGAKTHRCACVNLLDPSKISVSTEQSLNKNLEEYDGCHPKARSCYVT